jgi:hypothetical protein
VKDLLPTGKGIAGSFSLPVRTDTIFRHEEWRSAPTAEKIHTINLPLKTAKSSQSSSRPRAKTRKMNSYKS